MDARLRAALAMFPQVRVGADIGANHGLLACSLLERGRAHRMWVTDLSADALARAKMNIQRRGLTDRVRFAVGDGFSALSEPVQAAAILGMGGETIGGILQSAPEDRLPDCLLCSAHSGQEFLRRRLYETGYLIADERVVCSAGRYYVLHLAQRQPAALPMPDERALFLGPCLMKQASAEYSGYLQRRLSAYQYNQSESGRQIFLWLQEEAKRIAADSESGA